MMEYCLGCNYPMTESQGKSGIVLRCLECRAERLKNYRPPPTRELLRRSHDVWAACCRAYGIPSPCCTGLRNYAMFHIRPGSFLEAVLCNDLAGAVDQVDRENERLLPNYVRFLYNRLPSGAWGSRAEYRKWLERGGDDAS